jgi:hypothetical protein
VTLSAACVAITAVFFFSPANFRKGFSILFIRPGLNNSSKRGQGIMQAVFGSGYDIFVAFTTGFISFRKGGVFYYSVMGRLPVGVFWIAPVTVFAGNFPHIGL